MALLTTANNEYIERSAPVVDSKAPYTAFGWFRLDADRNAFGHFLHVGGQYSPYDANTDFVGVNNDGTTFRAGTAIAVGQSSAGLGPALTLGQWYWVAMVRSSTTDCKFYSGTTAADGALRFTSTQNVSTRANSFKMFAGAYNSLGIIGAMAHVRFWTAALSLTELNAEAGAAAPVRTANLWSAASLDGADVATALLDQSGNGRHWSAVGALDVVSGPTFPGGGPSITSVSDDTPTNGQSITLTGTAFGTSGAVLLGGTTLTPTSRSGTSIVVPAARGLNRYGLALDLTVSDGTTTSAPVSVTLQPDAGWATVILTSVATTGAIEATPALAIGDQLHYDTVSGAVSVAADATFSASPGVASFDVEAWRSGDGWGAMSTQVISQTLEASASVAGAISAAGTLEMSVGQSLDGAASVAGTVTAAGTLALTTAHTLSGAAGISGALSAAGATQSTVAVSLSGAAGISGTLSSAGALASEGQFLIAGSAGLSGTASAAGSVAVGTAVALSGAAGLAGTLSAAGAVLADSPANVTGAASVSGALSAAGAITFEAPAFGGGWLPPRRKRAKREEEEAKEEAPQIAEEVQEKPKRAPRVFRLKKADTRAAELIEKGRRQARLQAEDELLLLM